MWRRYGAWYASRTRFALHRSPERLLCPAFHHSSTLLRRLEGVDMRLQHNKVENLRLAVARLDGLVVQPGEVFSYWRLIGRPSARRGFRTGLILFNGEIREGIGGGLCQLSNLIYWMTLHTPLGVRERWRHSFDVFPDVGRTQPFGSGATCAYNYIDLQIENTTGEPYQLCLWLDAERLHGEWRTTAEPTKRYEIVERDHMMRQESWGGYSRHNRLYRRTYDRASGAFLGEEFVAANHALMMYSPLLPRHGGPQTGGPQTGEQQTDGSQTGGSQTAGPQTGGRQTDGSQNDGSQNDRVGSAPPAGHS